MTIYPLTMAQRYFQTYAGVDTALVSRRREEGGRRARKKRERKRGEEGSMRVKENCINQQASTAKLSLPLRATACVAREF